MDNVTYGLTMTILGMGGTLVSLWIISLAMNILKKFFPYQPEEKEKKGEGNVGSH
jgi:Na+-transporting methylmalonyl-CoA/oxaloacetate decarboxylase gamma subunit